MHVQPCQKKYGPYGVVRLLVDFLVRGACRCMEKPEIDPREIGRAWQYKDASKYAFHV